MTTTFACRCGYQIATSDCAAYTQYEKARKDHETACPMRFDPPWPFDRLPRIVAQLTGRTSTAGPIGGEAVDPAAPDSGTVHRDPVASPATVDRRSRWAVPVWIQRRMAVAT